MNQLRLLQRSTRPDAFIETGAVYYAGYEGKVYASFASQTGLEFFEYLTECETVWDAYTYTEPKTDPQTGGKFIVEQVGADVRVFYRGFFWWAGEALATSTHTWLSLGQGGLTGGTCVDVLNDFAGSLTIQLDSLEVGTQQIVEGSDAQISFFDVQNREWGANGTVMHEHNAPCGGQITVTELEPTLGTPVRFEIDATLVYTTDYENWEQKSLQGEFVAINFVDLGQR